MNPDLGAVVLLAGTPASNQLNLQVIQGIQIRESVGDRRGQQWIGGYGHQLFVQNIHYEMYNKLLEKFVTTKEEK